MDKGRGKEHKKITVYLYSNSAHLCQSIEYMKLGKMLERELIGL